MKPITFTPLLSGLLLLFYSISPPLIVAGSETGYTSQELAQSLAKFEATKRSFMKGKSLFASGRFDRAAGDFHSCIERFPRHIYAQFYLANIHYLSQHYSEALAAIVDAEKNLDFMMALDAYAQERKIRSMEEVTKSLVDQYEATNSCQERLDLNEVYINWTQKVDKLRGLESREYLFQHTLRSDYACFHGNILVRLAKYDQALKHYMEAVHLNPINSQAHNNIIGLFYLAGRFVDAESHLQHAEKNGIGEMVNLKLKMLLMQALGKPTAGILEQEYSADGPGKEQVTRFSVNVNEGDDSRAPLYVNVYILFNPDTRDAILIDPGAADPRIEAYIDKNKLMIRSILITHGHPDHYRGAFHYSKLYQVAVTLPKNDLPLMGDAGKVTGHPFEPISQQTSMQAGVIPIQFYPTPGHTDGSVCLRIGSYLFSGDSLFETTIGRIPAANNGEYQTKAKKLVALLQKTIQNLPGDTLLLPGHGNSSRLDRVQEINPFLKSVRSGE